MWPSFDHSCASVQRSPLTFQPDKDMQMWLVSSSHASWSTELGEAGGGIHLYPACPGEKEEEEITSLPSIPWAEGGGGYILTQHALGRGRRRLHPYPACPGQREEEVTSLPSMPWAVAGTTDGGYRRLPSIVAPTPAGCDQDGRSEVYILL